MARSTTKVHIMDQSKGTRDNSSDLKRSEITLKPRTSVVSKMCAFGLGVFVRFLRNRYRQLRPSVDFGIALVGLMFASPLFLIAGLITKICSPGPVFYIQARVGKDGRVFNIIKFRTMCVNAESQTGPTWTKENDTRITGFGRILRKTHLDELPQLINVLKGEMSIIGPRPERPYFVNSLKKEIHGYTGRFSVKPGITGLAQCYCKYDESISDVKRKLRYDFIYIKKMCWMLDLKILWRTLNVCLLGGKP
jgi:lipopolysaccharide/colanic/teichoic acid biosynthesis glycosyltransferase